MPDLNDLLGEAPEVWTGNEEKKGAPVLDMDDIGSLLGEEPQVWSGANEKKKGAPVLDEQVVLDDPAAAYQQTEKKQEVVLEGNVDDLLSDSAPEAYDEVGDFCKKLQFDDHLKETFMGLDAEKQQQIVEMRAKQLGIPAPMIPNALRPKAEESLPEAAEVELEEAPQTEEYVPQFKDEDLERIKEESKKPQKYVPPPVEMTEEKRKENVRIMNELREQREKELAHKGFIQLIILTVVGIIGAAAFALFFSASFLPLKPEFDPGWMQHVKNAAPIIGVVMGISALVLAAPVPQLKGLTKFVYVIGFILTMFPGIPLLIGKDGNGALNGLFFGLSAVCCLAVVIVMSISDGINMYNKHGNS